MGSELRVLPCLSESRRESAVIGAPGDPVALIAPVVSAGSQ